MAKLEWLFHLWLGSKFRHRFVTMGLERKASPYASRSKLTEEQRIIHKYGSGKVGFI